MSSLKLALLLLGTAILVCSGVGQLICYSCVSPEGDHCGEKFDNKTAHRVPCIMPHDACLKEVVDKTISRHCGEANKCKTSQGCYSCPTSLCNSSMNVKPPLAAIGVSAFFVLKYFSM